MKNKTIGHITCKLGQSAIENWELFEAASPEHYFFHLSSYPSGYLILETDDPSIDVIFECALLCKNGTKYRNLKNVNVDYCLCSNLKKGLSVGEVQFIRPRKVKKIKI